MFEFDQYQRHLHRAEPAVPTTQYDPATDVSGMSLLFWGEHCIECAAPACYTNCQLYQPRKDLTCRRFSYGMYKNHIFKSLRGYGAELAFKKWGRLDAFGNTAIYPVDTVLRWERLVEGLVPATNAAARVIRQVTGKPRWATLTSRLLRRLSQALHQRGRRGLQPDAFLLEVYNPFFEHVRLQVVFEVFRSDPTTIQSSAKVQPVLSTVSLAPGYSRHEFDAILFRDIVDAGLPLKIGVVPEADSNVHLVFLTADLVTFKTPRRLMVEAKATKETNIKCVVWDLDNTLWIGVLAEGDQIELRDGIRELIQHLDERGILMSIASKNSFEAASQALAQMGIAEYFLFPQINWSAKSQNIRSIASNLNIGLDTVAFVDDNPFELEEVGQALPEVACVGVDKLPGLANDPRFQGGATPESRMRRVLYKNQIMRDSERVKYQADEYLSFLASCEIVLAVSEFRDEDRERVSELVQRTNQLNFSGHHYTPGEMDQAIGDRTLEKYVIQCSDRYGVYGTVGFCLARRTALTLEILDFMLSCRVQGKFIEQALFAHLPQHSVPPAKSLWVNFHDTGRNKPAEDVLKSLGFRRCDPLCDGHGRGMVRNVDQALRCDFITVRCSSLRHQGSQADPERASVDSDCSIG